MGAILNVFAFITATVMMAVTFWYCPLIITRRVTPAPATWVIGSSAMSLSAASYYATGKPWTANVTLYAAAVEILIVTATLLVTLWRYRELHIAFDRVQQAFLAIMALVVIYWCFNREGAKVTYWTTQALLVTAYVATITKAIQKRSAFDSIGNWGMICGASMIGIIPALILRSEYGLINSARAVSSSGLTLLVLVYYDRKNQWRRWRDEQETLARFYKLT